MSTEIAQIVNWINASELSEEKKIFAQQHLEKYSQEAELKEFQIMRLQGNLKINTRFLNKAVEDLESTVDLLKESNSQLGNFTQIASHDLKSPLRSISSFSALLNKKLKNKLNPKEVEYLEIIESSAKAMSELIDDLLTYTRINSECLNIKEESLSNIINGVLQNLDFDIKQHDAIIENNLPRAIISCDSIKVKQVLQNLIANGIKFSSFENNKPHIVLNLKEESNRWLFSVKDNGIGVEENFKEVIFAEFKKLNGDLFDGTGMGLSIVKKIVTKHKGEIWIADSQSQGTTFQFSISKDLESTAG